MKKIIILPVLILFSVKAFCQKKVTELPLESVTYLFYPYERGLSGSVDSFFMAVDSIFNSVKKLDVLPKGSFILKQITLQTIIAFKGNGENFAYEKKYIIAKKKDGVVIFYEEYLKDIGAIFEYKDRNVLAQVLTRFLVTTSRAYKFGKK